MEKLKALKMCPSGKLSMKLRLSEQIAELAGFKYNSAKYPYGGFFDIIELETVKAAFLKAMEAAKGRICLK